MSRLLLLWNRNALTKLVRSHLDHIFNAVDPVKEETIEYQIKPKTKSKQTRFHPNLQYLFPVLVVALTIVQGLIGFRFNDDTKDENEESPWLDSSHFVTHQVFPRPMWFFVDMIVLISLMAISSLYLMLLCTPPLSQRCYLYLGPIAKEPNKSANDNSSYPNNPNDQILTSWEAFQIGRFRHRTRSGIKLFLAIWVLCVEVQFTYQLFVLRTVPILANPWALFYWTLLVPVFVYYALFVELLMPVYFILTSKYAQVRQRFLLNRFKALLKKKELIKSKLTLVWSQFIKLNTRFAALCRLTQETNRFWSRYLSVYFTMYTLFTCYSAYILLLSNADLGQKYIFVFLLFYSIPQLGWIIRQCAAVVGHNHQVDRGNQRFYRELQLLNSLEKDGKGRGDVKLILKAQSLALTLWEHENAGQVKYGYTLVNGYRIDFATFFYAFYNISVFFMLNFRSQTR